MFYSKSVTQSQTMTPKQFKVYFHNIHSQHPKSPTAFKAHLLFPNHHLLKLPLQNKHISSPPIRPIQPSPMASRLEVLYLSRRMWFMKLNASLNIQITGCELPDTTVQFLRGEAYGHYSIQGVRPGSLAWWICLSRSVEEG